MSEINQNTGILPPEPIRMKTVTGDLSVTHEVSEEFVLPDYLAPIRKILAVKARVLPEGKFLTETGAQCTGTVTYAVVYTDEDGALASASLASSYEANASVPQNATDLTVTTRADTVNCRVLAPRKLHVKTRLKSRFFCYGNDTVGETQNEGRTTDDELSTERLFLKVPYFSSRSGSAGDLKIAEKFDTDGKPLRPIHCNAVLTVGSAVACDDGIEMNGEIRVRCLAVDADTEIGEKAIPIAVEKVIPLHETVECVGTLRGDLARGNGRCLSLSISAENGENGSGQLFFDLVYALECESFRAEEGTVTKDCYSTACPTECVMRSVPFYRIARVGIPSFTQNETVPRKEKGDAEILDLFADAVPERSEIKNGKWILSGKTLVTVIACGGEDRTTFFGEDYEVPFRYECDVPNTAVAASQYVATVGKCEGRYDGDRFCFTGEIYLSCAVLAENEIPVVSSVRADREHPYGKGGFCDLTVCYPAGGETLWDVAKAYHVAPKRLAELNGLSGNVRETLAVRKILI